MRLIKLFFAVILIMAFSIISLMGLVLLINKNTRRRYLINTTSFFSGKLLDALDISVAAIHSPLWKKNRPYLVVANHMSYIDILALASIMPSVFVSSMEIRKGGFLGVLARCGSTLFVERRNRFNLKQEINEISDTLKSGFNVVLFPEGTSSNGERVLPFKKSLMETAFQSQTDVLPVCLAYYEEKSNLSIQRAESVCWHGDMAFMPHFINLLKQKKLIVTMQIMEPLRVSAFTSRHALSEDAHNIIVRTYKHQKPYAVRVDIRNPEVNY